VSRRRTCRSAFGFEDEQKRVIAGTFGDLRVINLYVVNGQDVGTDKYAYKLRWLEAVHAWIAEELQRHPKLIVMGDFNIAPDARDVHDPEVWNDDHILTSTAERGALQQAAAAGPARWLPPAQRRGGVFSWWDYRAAGFRRNLGLRIDLTLVSDALRAAAVASGIDREPRTWERPSDHAPAWVQLVEPQRRKARHCRALGAHRCIRITVCSCG
jgi:exodeoxyribonuclease-3